MVTATAAINEEPPNPNMIGLSHAGRSIFLHEGQLKVHLYLVPAVFELGIPHSRVKTNYFLGNLGDAQGSPDKAEKVPTGWLGIKSRLLFPGTKYEIRMGKLVYISRIYGDSST